MSNKKKNLSTYSQIPPHHAPLRAITKESHSQGPRDCGPNSSRQMLCKGHRQSRWQNRHPVLPESQPMLGPSEEILPRLTAKLAKASWHVGWYLFYVYIMYITMYVCIHIIYIYMYISLSHGHEKIHPKCENVRMLLAKMSIWSYTCWNDS
jgi:hypothetical protein